MHRLDRWLPFIWVGSVPPKLFMRIYIRARLESMLLDNERIFLSRLLFETVKKIKFALKPKFSNLFGIVPIKLLSFNHKYLEDEQFVRDVGIGPLRLFTIKLSIFNSFKNPNSFGI